MWRHFLLPLSLAAGNRPTHPSLSDLVSSPVAVRVRGKRRNFGRQIPRRRRGWKWVFILLLVPDHLLQLLLELLQDPLAEFSVFMPEPDLDLLDVEQGVEEAKSAPLQGQGGEVQEFSGDLGLDVGDTVYIYQRILAPVRSYRFDEGLWADAEGVSDDFSEDVAPTDGGGFSQHWHGASLLCDFVTFVGNPLLIGISGPGKVTPFGCDLCDFVTFLREKSHKVTRKVTPPLWPFFPS